jgi:predicted ATP-dependent endonuclease of OLD family
MNDNQAKYIERIEIEGFWGRYDLNWGLNPDVNILVGENGTGKSSLLMLLNLILNRDKAGFTDKFMDSDSIKIYENNEIIAFDGKVNLGVFGGIRRQEVYVPQGKMSSALNVS